jgi:hypothetical protein
MSLRESVLENPTLIPFAFNGLQRQNPKVLEPEFKHLPVLSSDPTAEGRFGSGSQVQRQGAVSQRLVAANRRTEYPVAANAP